MPGIAESLIAAGVGGMIVVGIQTAVSKRNDEIQEKEMSRLATDTEKKLLETKADHAREIGEIRGTAQAAHAEIRVMMQKISDKMGEIDRKMDGFSVALIGLDGQNGVRGQVKTLSEDHRDLRERVMRLDYAVRRIADVEEAQ